MKSRQLQYYYPWEVVICTDSHGNRYAYLKTQEERRLEYRKRSIPWIDDNCSLTTDVMVTQKGHQSEQAD